MAEFVVQDMEMSTLYSVHIQSTESEFSLHNSFYYNIDNIGLYMIDWYFPI